jgi:hypothetical protein
MAQTLLRADRLPTAIPVFEHIREIHRCDQLAVRLQQCVHAVHDRSVTIDIRFDIAEVDRVRLALSQCAQHPLARGI